MSVFTALLLAVLADSPGLRIRHLDMSDHRRLSNVGRLDLTNVIQAIRFWCQSAVALTRRPDALYFPIAQSRLGVLRDAGPLVLARCLRVQRIVHLHGALFSDFYRSTDPGTRFLARWALKGARGVVLDESLAAALLPVIPVRDVTVIQNAVPDLGMLERAPRPMVSVLHFSSVSAAKGVDTLIEAVDRLRDPSVRLTVCGEMRPPGWLDEYRRRFPDTTIDYIAGTESLDEKRDLFHAADIFVLCSRNEGQPLAVIEAMSTGLPIVATAVGAVPTLLHHGSGGYVVAPADPAALAEALRELVQDPAARRRMGMYNRRLYETFYQPPRLRGDFIRLFGEVAG